ncbi:anhydro-N-acetylmuramic acid kinase [Mesocricetibacter intestinalis]|uniref:Anhydro-N-acetylmuramic acid kinase n=1 Tax=Mesocricetibacter intestinalis TaxID=1521930 RepID=A0A4R6V7L7_9PAST|nr:anhydro-N-acetylmuramic acid kinase [Mesocricetibacter intestinalis]TDQ57596.1 anhydro-N-acetylmuramic acid kinase [Mesocricetibacter intestinalis]
MSAQYYIGVMSGTSLDGVDLALMDFSRRPWQLVAADFTPMPEKLRQKLTALLCSGETSLSQLGELDHRLGLLYADCIKNFLGKIGLQANQIVAVGCHGQTLWHAPRGDFPFSMQIGDANLIAAKTGIQVIADFRRKDMAYGGQGAPLVPAFHQALFSCEGRLTVVLNIGGISNISILHPPRDTLGYDVGPGNTLSDLWIRRHLGLNYDKNACWAQSGKVCEPLLRHLLEEPFLRLKAPKSTGRELFNLDWLDKKLQNFAALSAADVQRTLIEFSVHCIREQLHRLQRDKGENLLLVCGGGAKNPLIMRRLSELLPQWRVAATDEYGFDGDYMEAAAFAWLAYCRIHNLPSNLPGVTGAQRAVSLGVIYPN